MKKAVAREERERAGQEVVSPFEAAYVTELSRRTVDQAIDRREVRALAGRRGGVRSRALGYPELVYLGLRRQVGALLSPRGRRSLYRELRGSLDRGAIPSAVQLGPVTVDLERVVARVDERLARLRAAEEWVTVGPGVRAGEPVVRGTRVPVHMLADLIEQGATPEELLEDYPGVGREALEAAVLYARLHPRRGRPRRAPWHPDAGMAPGRRHAGTDG